MDIDEAISLGIKRTCEKAGRPDLYNEITWEWNTRLRTTAGRAYKTGKLEFSLQLFNKIPAEEIVDTIIHETCHYLEWRMYGTFGHGSNWKRLMRKTGGNPQRCHDIDVESLGLANKKQKRYEVYCPCQTHKVTKRIYKRILNHYRYTCTDCKKTIFTEKVNNG